MVSRSTPIPKIATALVLCGVLIATWAVVEHRRADAAISVRSTASDPAGTPPTASPTPSTVNSLPAAEAQAAPDRTAIVQQALAAALAGEGGNVGIEVLDRATGAAIGYQSTLSFQTASIVKVDILATLLYQNQQAGRKLSDDQRDLAEAMITESDNGAASALWEAIGGASGLATANRTFGLIETTPGEDDYWGATTTTPADQIRLLSMLCNDSGPLSADNRSYELTLMANVESDQRWGVPAAAGSTATAIYVKNGWLSSDNDDGLWVVNSIGRIIEPGHDWLVAVLANHESDEDPTITLIQKAAAIAVNGLG
jgi:beta-lactamase class A